MTEKPHPELGINPITPQTFENARRYYDAISPSIQEETVQVYDKGQYLFQRLRTLVDMSRIFIPAKQIMIESASLSRTNEISEVLNFPTETDKVRFLLHYGSRAHSYRQYTRAYNTSIDADHHKEVFDAYAACADLILFYHNGDVPVRFGDTSLSELGDSNTSPASTLNLLMQSYQYLKDPEANKERVLTQNRGIFHEEYPNLTDQRLLFAGMTIQFYNTLTEVEKNSLSSHTSEQEALTSARKTSKSFEYAKKQITAALLSNTSSAANSKLIDTAQLYLDDANLIEQLLLNLGLFENGSIGTNYSRLQALAQEHKRPDFYSHLFSLYHDIVFKLYRESSPTLSNEEIERLLVPENKPLNLQELRNRVKNMKKGKR